MLICQCNVLIDAGIWAAEGGEQEDIAFVDIKEDPDEGRRVEGAEEVAEGADGTKPRAASEHGADEGRQARQAEEDLKELVLAERGYGGGSVGVGS